MLYKPISIVPRICNLFIYYIDRFTKRF